MNILFGTNITSEDEMEKWLKTKRPIYDHEPRNGEEMSLSRVGKDLYEKASKMNIRNMSDYYSSNGFFCNDFAIFSRSSKNTLRSNGINTLRNSMRLFLPDSRSGLTMTTDTFRIRIKHFQIKDTPKCLKTC